MLAISIGGTAIAFGVRNAAMARRIRMRYKGYLVPVRQASPAIRCAFSHDAFGSPENVKLTYRNGRWDAARRDFSCSWNLSTGDARVRPSIYSFDALLRVLVGTILPLRGGLLLHAAAVVGNGCAFVFAGPSGSGKTTVTRLAGTRRVLNDEISAVSTSGSAGPVVMGTPFWGEMGTGPSCKRSFPVNAILFPQRGERDEKVELPGQIALSKLLGCTCTFSSVAQDADRVLRAATIIVGSIPCYELRFRKTDEFWQLL